ncbi:virulence RhuM family protein [Capnocytophaga sp. oral taxon 380]|uniref:virulence RhuM family protein n=1 Tax=Capnocytophaga sp. oral taxon 380 TaxID=712217 RepID=UPI0002A31648|nr:RhuM family protein [Capnocytophaga sp. oral taxon 380]EKY07501.1 toxin-antitoxin system, toxin component, Fic family [Capnocytophaga sp. oral taxon 380 str. F0488]
MENQKGEILFYQREDGSAQIDVRLEEDTVWLTQQLMAELFNTSKQNISLHIQNIFEEGELIPDSTVKKFLTVQKEGTRDVRRQLDYYNLDMIISVGYRIKSSIATRFRQWATQRLKEYIIKGFTMDDERLKGNGGGDYWKELLNRIRDIRSSEKALYRQVLDLYATSKDYDSKSETTLTFFKVVQNKLHYASSLQTSAELIYNRADSTKDFMGLTTFKGALPTLNEAKIAKNYLTEEELFRLNRLVSAFFDLAELKAQTQSPMYMQDWVDELDKFSANYGKGVLKGAGSISHDEAEKKATREYRTYEARTLSPIEESYLESLKVLEKNTAKLLKK